MVGISFKVYIPLLIFFSVSLTAQYDFISILPGMEGTLLIDELAQQYKPDEVLEFGEAKDVMYSEIYEINDSVTCVYTGHTLYLDPEADPSQFLYLNGIDNGINAEHTYPKSKGAGNGNALSDLYNLFPTRLAVNADRGNLPFGEIPDALTDYWYYLDNRTTGIPSNQIDSYSEVNSNFFEPREDHKGNVARSIFYFVTMYAAEAENADPNFFELMRETLCAWHYQDPVDSMEWIRNELIASYQSGMLNPFILDCSLAGRSYCDFIDPACIAVGVEENFYNGFENNLVLIYPNPFSQKINIELKGDFGFNKVELIDLQGQIKYSKNIDLNNTADVLETTIHFEGERIPNGIYILEISGNNSIGQLITKRNLVVKNLDH